MAEISRPSVYSIAAHRGFADALVAGLVPRYSDPDVGLARLTLLLPSSRSARSVTEAFIRHFGETGQNGMLMPRMVTVGDLDLDEALGPLIDPLKANDIAPAVEPTRRWLELAEHIKIAMQAANRDVPPGAALLRLAREMAATFDRLTAEEISPESVLSDAVKDRFPDVAAHWQDNLWLFATVQRLWDAKLQERGEIDAAARRNLLFNYAAQQWSDQAPKTPIIAAGVTSAAPALARLLRVVADLHNGAVILPDLDLGMDDAAWDELGIAGQAVEVDGPTIGKHDAVTHPQYHLKMLLGRMGVNRAEIEPWHRKGIGASAPERSKAISAVFLPPIASKAWVNLEAKNRRLSGVRLMETPTLEEEAQAIALLAREALEIPEKRVALITPDRTLARRVVAHLARWGIKADDTAGLPLNLTASGRFLLQLADVICEKAAPVQLIAALSHPLVKRGEERSDWLGALRKFERKLRGPRPASGLAPLASVAKKAGVEEWWSGLEPLIGRLLTLAEAQETTLLEALDNLIITAEELAGESVWGGEDGRALSRFVEDLRLHAGQAGTHIRPADINVILRDAMMQTAVRPPYGGHPRVAIYGLLESRMTRADLVICAGLNEGNWPRIPTPDPLLAPAILRALGVPGEDFRIGLSAHDLAGALGAPEVVLSRSARDSEGPAIPSRFLLRVEALLGELCDNHADKRTPQWAKALDRQEKPAGRYPKPRPDPASNLRDVPIKVTALDRLLGDPYQFYAGEILKLKELEALDAEIGPAWQGTLVHDILDKWHKACKNDPDAQLLPIADAEMIAANVHPLMWGLWRPRLQIALSWIEDEVRAAAPDRTVLGTELKGKMNISGVRIYGRADRIDRLHDGSLAIVDYKTGKPPSGAKTKAGFALQLGLLGLIANDGGFKEAKGDATGFEHWSLSRGKVGFGYVDMPLRVGNKRSGLTSDEFLPAHRDFLDRAICGFIKGSDPFEARLNPDYPGYNTYDQLMRLDEWERNLGDDSDIDGGVE